MARVSQIKQKLCCSFSAIVLPSCEPILKLFLVELESTCPLKIGTQLSIFKCFVCVCVCVCVRVRVCLRNQCVTFHTSIYLSICPSVHLSILQNLTFNTISPFSSLLVQLSEDS